MTNINGYPTPWRATTAKFAEFDKSTILSRATVNLGGQEIVKLQGEVFDDIAAQAEKLYKAGVPVEEAVERYVIPEKYKTFRQFSWGFCIGQDDRTVLRRVVRQARPRAELFLVTEIFAASVSATFGGPVRSAPDEIFSTTLGWRYGRIISLVFEIKREIPVYAARKPKRKSWFVAGCSLRFKCRVEGGTLNWSRNMEMRNLFTPAFVALAAVQLFSSAAMAQTAQSRPQQGTHEGSPWKYNPPTEPLDRGDRLPSAT